MDIRVKDKKAFCVSMISTYTFIVWFLNTPSSME